MSLIFRMILLLLLWDLSVACTNKSGFEVEDTAALPRSLDQPEPVRPPPVIAPDVDPSPSRMAGVLDDHCMENNSYDACIFWKNPVAQRNLPFAVPLKFGQDLKETQIFGVKLFGQISPDKLASTTINVFSSDSADAPTDFKETYTQDSKHTVVQVHTYFWLSYMEKYLKERTGIFYASGKNIAVNAYDPNMPNNAKWTGSIILGATVDSDKNVIHELGLNAEMAIHEMGHANLAYSGGRASGNCIDYKGCSGAINEGQADFHYMMIFGNSTALGETASNNLEGWSSFGISRDVRKLAAMTAQQAFDICHGEAHAMGSLYASILWEIYNDPAVERINFEKIFLQHLQKLTRSTTFVTAKDILLAEDLAFYSGKYQGIITAAFAKKGL